MEKKRNVFRETIKMMKRKYNKKKSSSDLNSTEDEENDDDLRPDEINSSSRVSLPAQDARRTKRVRFAEPDAPHPLASEGPKTSEYAFCKKLREDAAHSFHSYELHKQHKRTERIEESTCAKELAKMAKPDDDVRSFSLTGRGTTLTIGQPVSPRVPLNSGTTKRAKLNHEIRYLSSTEEGTPTAFVSPYSHGTSVNPERDCEQKDIFSIKRQKLLHMATETLSLDNDKLRSKGYDLVSMLLQRLVPEETSCSRFGWKSSDSKFNSQLRVSPEADVHFEEVPRTPSIKSVYPFVAEQLNSLSDSWSNKSREWTPSQEVNEDLGSPVMQHPKKVFLEYETRNSANYIYSGMNWCSHSKKDSGFNTHPNKELSIYRDGYPAFDYKELSFNCESPEKSFDPGGRTRFRKLDEVSPDKLLFDTTPRSTQYLCWGSNNTEKEEDLLISPCGATLNTSSPTWRTSSEDNIFDTTGMQEICNCSDIILRDMSSSESYDINSVGKKSLEEREYEVKEPDDFPLTLCCTPKYLALENRCRFSSSIEQDTNTFDSPVTRSTVFSERLTPSLGTYLQSSLDSGYAGCNALLSIDDFTRPDLQLVRKDPRGISAFLLGRDTTETYMDDSLSNIEDQIQASEDAYGVSDLTPLTWKTPLNPLLLLGSTSNESGERSFDSDIEMALENFNSFS